MTPQCQQMQAELKAYHDGELPLLQRLAVRRHLAHCAACREEMRIMEHIGQQLQAEEVQTQTTLNPALREKILTAIPDRSTPDTPTATPEYSSPPWYRSFLFQSGAVVTAVLFFVMASSMFSAKRVTNTFNGAANAMSDDDDYAATSEMSVSRDAISKSAPRKSQEGEVLDRAAGTLSRSRFADSRELVKSKDAPITAGNYKRVAPAAPVVGAAREYSGGTDTSNVPASLRRVHQEARIAVAVTDVEEKSNIVIALVKGAEGFVANNTLSTGADGLKTAALTVKVPVKQFETVLSQIGKLGDVKAKNLSGEDITQQFSDAQQANVVMANELEIKEAQLKAALRRVEEAEKAKKPIPDTWQLRAETRRLRIEAAQTRARFDLLKKLSDLADISIELREKPRTASEGGFIQEMGDTSRAAMDSFLLAARLPITLLIWILAYAPLWLPMLLIYRVAMRAYQKKTP